MLSSCTTEMIEADAEPFVHFIVQLEVLVAKLFRCQLFFKSFRFRGSAVLISTANVQGIVSTC